MDCRAMHGDRTDQAIARRLVIGLSSSRRTCAQDGQAPTRPSDDVHSAMSGKTVEVVNTDAEGRLVQVLADWPALCEDPRLHPSDQRRHPHWSLRDCARQAINAGLFLERRRATCAKFEDGLPVSGEKYLLAPSRYRRLSRPHQERDRRHHEYRQESLAFGGATIGKAMFLKRVRGRHSVWSISILPAAHGMRRRSPGTLTGPAALLSGRSSEWVRSYSA